MEEIKAPVQYDDSQVEARRQGYSPVSNVSSLADTMTSSEIGSQLTAAKASDSDRIYRDTATFAPAVVGSINARRKTNDALFDIRVKQQEQNLKEAEFNLERRKERLKQLLTANAMSHGGLNPDEEAQIRKIADDTGYTVEAVRTNLASYKKGSFAKNLSAMADNYNNKGTIEYFSDPNNVALAHDDVDNIRNFEDILNFTADLTLRAPTAGLYEGTVGLGTNVSGFAIHSIGQTNANAGSYIEQMSDPSQYIVSQDEDVGGQQYQNNVENFNNESVKAAHEYDKVYQDVKWTAGQIAGERITNGRWKGWASGLISGSRSMGAMVPQMLLGTLTGGATVPLTMAGVMEGTNAFMEDMSEGRNYATAIGHGIWNGATEVATELLPMHYLFKNRATMGYAKRLGMSYLTEMPTELVATTLQNLGDSAAKFNDKDVDWIANPDFWKGYFKELPNALWETAWSVLPMSIGSTAMTHRYQRKSAESMTKAYDALNDNVKASKLQGRDAENHKIMARTVAENSGVTEVHYDKEKWDSYFQSQEIDPEQAAKDMGATYDANEEFVTMPIEEFTSKMIPNGHAEALRADATFSKEKKTLNQVIEQEAQINAEKEKLKAEIDELSKESEGWRKVNDVTAEFEENLKQLLIHVGKKTPKTASVEAQLNAAFYTTSIIRNTMEIARQEGREATPEECARAVRSLYAELGFNVTRGGLSVRKNVEPFLDSMIETIRSGTEEQSRKMSREAYGQSITEFVKANGKIAPTRDILRAVKDGRLPRSILRKGATHGADTMAELAKQAGYDIDDVNYQGDDALLMMLEAEHAQGERHYSNQQYNAEKAVHIAALNDLSNDMWMAGVDVKNDSNEVIRQKLAEFDGEKYGREDSRAVPETENGTVERYEQRGFVANENATAEEIAEANRQYDEVVAKYKDTEQWMKAPNGADTNLNEPQWVQVRTENFKKWAGDWENDKANATKILDENGEPKVFYHGSVSEFDAFDKSKIRELDYDANFNGFWFSEDSSTSPAMTDARYTYPVFLNIRNPIGINERRKIELQARNEVIEDIRKGGGELSEKFRSEHDYARYLMQEKGYDGVHWDGKPEVDREALERDGKVLIELVGGAKRWLVKDEDGYLGYFYNGYDDTPVNQITDFGDVDEFLNIKEEIYVAFEPNQIKSATGNAGTFKEDNNNIYYQTTEHPNKKQRKPKRTKADPSYMVTAENKGRANKRTISNLTEVERRVYDEFKADNPDAERIEANLKRLEGTPWASRAMASIFNRMAIRYLIAGKPIDFESHLNGGQQEALRRGLVSDGIDFIKNRYSGLDVGSVISKNEKAVNTVNSSFLNCEPSEDCAKFCYAANGTLGFTNSLIKGELINYLAENDPEWLGKQIAKVYKNKPEYQLQKALRFFDTGDGNESWLKVVNVVNSEKVRLQIFSKRPDFLRQVPDYNVRLLSIDKSNIELAEKNKDLPVAFVFESVEQLPDVKRLFERGQLQLLLPVELKSGNETAIGALDAVKEQVKGIAQHICPVNSGKAKVGEYTCLKCDNKAGVGCFAGQATAKKIHLVGKLQTNQTAKQMSDAFEKLQKSLEEYTNESGRTEAVDTDTDSVGRSSTEHRGDEQSGQSGSGRVNRHADAVVSQLHNLIGIYEQSGKTDPTGFLEELTKRMAAVWQTRDSGMGDSESRNNDENRSGTGDSGQVRRDGEGERRESDVEKFYQSANTENRGATRIMRDDNGVVQQMNIELFEKANFSTFSHESAHYMLEVMAKLVAENRASNYLIGEFETIMKYLGTTKEEWFQMTGEQKREYHETFARSFEAYLMEGKAPSEELRGAFQRFKDWMVNIYRQLASLNVKLSDDIRGVFDRMLASDEQIELASKTDGVRSFIATAEELGMTQKEFEDYKKIVNSEVGTAQDKLRARLMKAEVRKRQKQYKDQLLIARRKAEKEWKESEFVQHTDMFTGEDRKLALNKAQLVSIYGEAFLKKLPRRNGRTVYDENGVVDVQEFAQDYGYESSDALIKSIAQMKSPKEWIDNRAKGIVAEYFGDEVNSVEASEAVDEAMNNEHREERLRSELKLLRKAQRIGEIGKKAERQKQQELLKEKLDEQKQELKAKHEQEIAELKQKIAEEKVANRWDVAEARKHEEERIVKLKDKHQKQIDAINEKIEAQKEARREAREYDKETSNMLEALKRAAVDGVRRRKAKEITPRQYLNAMRKWSGRARQALNKQNPDYAKASECKRMELICYYQYNEAVKLQKKMRSGLNAISKILRRPVKDMKDITMEYVYHAKALSARLLGRNYEIWDKRISTENRYGVGTDIDYSEVGNIRDINIMDALSYIEDVKGFMDMARRDGRIEINGKMVDVEKAEDELLKELSAHGESYFEPNRHPSIVKKFNNWLSNRIVSMTRMEHWCDMVGGKQVGNMAGAWTRYIFRPIKQAAEKARLDQIKYTKALGEIIDGFKFVKQDIDAHELGYVFGKDTGFGKAELIHALLHTGNKSNLERLIVGRGWGIKNEDGSIDTSRWDAFIRRMMDDGIMTEEDMDRVQQIWDLFEKLKPESQKAHKAVYGRYFDEISSDAFEMFGKQYTGGYVPAIYDPHLSTTGDTQEFSAEKMLDKNGSMLPSLEARWGNSRAQNFSSPLLLDMSALRNHLNDQILFAHMAPASKDVSKVLARKSMLDAMKQYHPDFYKKVVVHWMTRAVTQNVNPSGTDKAAWLSKIRSRAGTAIMFFNVVNAVEGFFDLTAAFAKVKSVHLTSAFKEMTFNRKATIERVMQASAYMQQRLKSEANAANDLFEQSLRPSRLKKIDNWINDHAYFMQEMVDGFTAPVVWLGAYNQALEGNLSEDEAIAQADSTVRSVFGANSAEDIANFEGGGAFRRVFTQFTGYFVNRANLITSQVSKFNRDDFVGNRRASIAYIMLMSAMLPAWIGSLIRRAAAGGGDDDETFGAFLMDTFGWSTMSYFFSMGGFVGQGLNAMVDRAKGGVNAGRIMYSPTAKALNDALNIMSVIKKDGEVNGIKFARSMVDLERCVPFLPVIPTKLFNSAVYDYKVMSGKVSPKGAYDFVRGTITGRASAGTESKK